MLCCSPRKILLVGLLLIPALLWALYAYLLNPQRMAGVVEARIASAYGGPVKLGEANVGLSSSTLHRLEVYELEPQGLHQPWLTVDKIETDLALSSLSRGAALPSQLELEGVAITLRLDESGHLLTGLPTAGPRHERLPKTQIKNATVTLCQLGRPDFVASGVNAALDDDGKAVSLKGTVTDPYWGNWRLRGTWKKETMFASFSLDTQKSMHLTQSMLEKLPFVPAKVWREVHCEGDTGVVIEVFHQPWVGPPRGQFARENVEYKIRLNPSATSVHVRRIDLHAEQAHGDILIADKVVHLHNVAGAAAEGELRTEATLDFNGKPSRMHFLIDAGNINVQKLPHTWGLTAQFAERVLSGRLFGKADLLLQVLDGKAKTSGEGQGEIRDTRLAGIPVSRPLKLTLQADGNRFKFKILGVPVGLGFKMPRPTSPGPTAPPGGARQP
ncbi:MAG TPA: hypothetical protein VGY66_08300 [Gemmataceae bacterium]|jgi:hypothetical protein|nr:hypothetical protein [Gemmataceae bacterium]